MHVVATPSRGFLTQLIATALPKLLGLPFSSSISVWEGDSSGLGGLLMEGAPTPPKRHGSFIIDQA